MKSQFARLFHDVDPRLQAAVFVFLDCRWSIRKYVYMSLRLNVRVFLHLCEFLFTLVNNLSGNSD